MLNIQIVEDNLKLRQALKIGLENTEALKVVDDCGSGENALAFCLAGNPPDAILMDVQLEGGINGIQAAVQIRREFPRLPVVFYSIQDDDAYYRDFRQSGILSHYAYVRKSNYLLPAMIIPLIKDAVAGRSFIDPEIETRVQEVRHKDEQDPLALLEPNEQVVARMLAQGLTNEQMINFVKGKVKSERIAKDIDQMVNVLSTENMTPSEVRSFVTKSMEESFATGASWTGRTPGAKILILIVVVIIIVCVVKKGGDDDDSSDDDVPTDDGGQDDYPGYDYDQAYTYDY